MHNNYNNIDNSNNINNITNSNNFNNGNNININNLNYINSKNKFYTEEEAVKLEEERKKYLFEKEKMIQKRNQRKKIVKAIVLSIVVLILFCYAYKNYLRPVKIDPRIDKSSIHYATDLYYSDGRYYDKYLDLREKKFYLHIFDDIKQVRKTSKVSCTQFGYDNDYECVHSFNKIVYVILMEHPDLFWYRTTAVSYINNGKDGIKFEHEFVTTNKLRLYFVERRLLRKIDEIALKYENNSNYEKIKNVYTWLGKDKDYSDIITTKDGTAWSALLENDAVCAGFAAASQLLFQRLGFESMIVLGSLQGEAHAWNFVHLEDGYYWYDATVGGSRSYDNAYFYDGLLFSDRSKYSVDFINEKEIVFGKKYLNK